MSSRSVKNVRVTMVTDAIRTDAVIVAVMIVTAVRSVTTVIIVTIAIADPVAKVTAQDPAHPETDRTKSLA
jgi:hypothetical protein